VALFTDYDGLAQAVKTWCARSDTTFSNQIPTFVAFMEQRLYSGSGEGPSDPLFCDPLNAPEQETTATVSLTDGVGTMPSDVVTLRTITRANDMVGLEFMSPRQWAVKDADLDTGDPAFYTIEGTSLKVTPSYTGDLSLFYYKRFTTIGPENTSGALLTAYPLIYLSGTLFEAFSFMQEPELAVQHFARYRAHVAGINTSANQRRFGGGPIKIRTRQGMP
jgi:hypothetical protein